jgi:hypothetical protein
VRIKDIGEAMKEEMNCIFVNIKNQREYTLIGFRQFKDCDKWVTLIEYKYGDTIFLRRPEDFHRSFTPLQFWKTANIEQRNKMKSSLKEATNKAEILNRPIPRHEEGE